MVPNVMRQAFVPLLPLPSRLSCQPHQCPQRLRTYRVGVRALRAINDTDDERATSAVNGAYPGPPLRQGRVSHAIVLEQVAAAIRAHDGRRMTVDFPPERTETRSGTLVARYENNLNFAERLLIALGGASPQSIGGTVSIRDNVNPQGGGEYLDDDETLTGLRADGISVILNAGVDSSTLRQTPDLDDGGAMVLINCGLDRLSWFARRSLRDALNGFESAYYFKVIAGAGFLLKASPHPWRVFAYTATGCDVVLESEDRPKMGEVESAVRSAAAKKNDGMCE